MADRTVVLSQNGRHAVRGLSVNNPSEFSAYQDDDDDLTYIVDMSSYLDGATITLVTRVPEGITITNTSNTSTRITQRLKGFGYVDFRVLTSSGDVEEFRINVLRRTGSKVVLGGSSGGGANFTPGDYGDITVSGSGGTTWTIDADAVTTAKIADGAVTSSKILDGTIIDQDINASAAIAATKLSFTQSGTGAVTRSIDARLKDWISVKDFGATGNGSTDDYSAVNNAIQAAAAANKAVYVPAGTYIIGTTINLPSNTTIYGERKESIFKLRAQSWTASNGLLFSASVVSSITLVDLVIDGNKGNLSGTAASGTTRSPIIVIFNTQKVQISDCVFQNVEGICLNISTNVDDLSIVDCVFNNCGGNPSNADGYRKQAIALSGSAGSITSNVLIDQCSFFRQGLDCISLAYASDVRVTNCSVWESYTLVYSVSGYACKNIVIDGNVVNTCSEFGAATSVPPHAIDLTDADAVTISDNAIFDCDGVGIGVFSGCSNVIVSGNVVVNPMLASTTFNCGIAISDSVNNVLIQGNLIVDKAGTPLMRYGIVIKTNATNILVRDNVIRNPLTANFGYYSASIASVANISTFTDASQLSSSTRIVDVQVGSNLETVYGLQRVYANDNSNAALTIRQLGSGNALVVEDESSETTPFVIDASGNVGIGTSSPGYKLDVSGTARILGATLISDNTASTAFEIRQTGSGHAFLVEDSANPDATPFTIRADGSLIVGNTAAFSASTVTPGVNFQGIGGVQSPAQVGITAFSNDINGPVLYMTKSRGASAGTHGLVSSGDTLGAIFFEGSDGTTTRRGAAILGFVDGATTSGVADMPGRIEFRTAPDGSATVVERLRIGSDGTLTIADAGNIAVGTTTGTKIGTATTQKLAFYNATPIVQRAAAAQAAVATTAATQTTPWGFSTQAQADGIITLLNEIRTTLVNLGLMKGSA